MRSHPGSRRSTIVQRAARVAYTFVVMNVSAITGLLAVAFRRKVWR
jgi:hypothetical protein